MGTCAGPGGRLDEEEAKLGRIIEMILVLVAVVHRRIRAKTRTLESSKGSAEVSGLKSIVSLTEGIRVQGCSWMRGTINACIYGREQS
jgi:hypothetical protein